MLLTTVWSEQPGKYFCISTKDRKGQWKDNFFSRRQFGKVEAFINDNFDKDIYWCVHGFEKPRRLKDYAVLPNLCWADLDEADPREITPQPTIAIESSPNRFVGVWKLTSEVTESMNRRLTQHVGADPGGWDLTQVLRVPGTRNFKYEPPPTVRLLWDEGHIYDVAEIERVLPKDDTDEAGVGQAVRIYNKYKRAFKPFVRRELLRGKPTAGKRSEVLWRLTQELIEAGVSEEEAFILLSQSPWNKFRNRRGGARQIRREISKALSGKFTPPPVDHDEEQEIDDEPRRILNPRTLDQVVEERIDWIWYPYLARGEMTIIEGDPQAGKSYLTQMVAAAIADGKQLPVWKKSRRNRSRARNKVVYFDIENSAETVTKRRLVDNKLKHGENYILVEQPFSVDNDDAMDEVHELLSEVKPALVVFDTIATYTGRADTHKQSETQQMLGKFTMLAKRYHCAVAVLRHLTKGNKDKAIYRGQGSIAFTGMARIVLSVGQHPDDDDMRVAVVTKNNVAKAPPGLEFTIEDLPDTLKYTDRSKFTWGDFNTALDSEVVINTVPDKKSPRKERQAEIESFLNDFLSGGPQPKPKIERAGSKLGYGPKVLLRAADRMGVIRHKPQGFGPKKQTIWELSENGDSPPHNP
jgi:hypothetical protein